MKTYRLKDDCELGNKGRVYTLAEVQQLAPGMLVYFEEYTDLESTLFNINKVTDTDNSDDRVNESRSPLDNRDV